MSNLISGENHLMLLRLDGFWTWLTSLQVVYLRKPPWHNTDNLMSSLSIVNYLYYHHSRHKTRFPIMVIRPEQATIKGKINFVLNNRGLLIILAAYSAAQYLVTE